MTLLKNWSDIDLTKIQNEHVEKELSASAIHVLRTLESILEGSNSEVQAHQCISCGNFFYIGKYQVDTLKDDSEGGKLCKFCSGDDDPNQEKTTRWKKLLEITFAIKEWEESGKNDPILYNKITLLSKDYFEFNSVQEMYINFHKFGQQVNEENEELKNEVNPAWLSIIDDVVELAKKSNYGEYCNMVLGYDRVEQHEIQETMNMLEGSIVRGELEYWLPKIQEHTILSIGIKTKKNLDRLRIKLTMLKYAQIVEFGFIYDVLYNLATISKGGKFTPNPFPPDANGNPIYPYTKIQKIRNVNSDLVKIIDAYYVNTLRNAIVHAKYRVDDHFIYKNDKRNWKLSIDQVKMKTSVAKRVYGHLLNKITHSRVEILEKNQQKPI